MIYVKAEDLKVGMRLARPIYNKKGILLYGRNDKITAQGIESVKNFGLIGLYILEPAEPLPPMSEEEIEFERFQTMAVFIIREELDHIMEGKAPENLMGLTDDLVRRFGNLFHKIRFNQNLRSPEDYVYKHALNVAILTALISHRVGFGVVEQAEVIVAALLHDVGKLGLPEQLRSKGTNVEPEERDAIARAVLLGVDKISKSFKMPAGVKGSLMQMCQLQYMPEKLTSNVSDAVKVLMVANAYDEYTAMRLGEDPASEVEAIRELQSHPELYDAEMVQHLLESVQILFPGVCVELTNHEKGLVIRENDQNVLRPVVLGFNTNQIYNLNLGSVHKEIQIKDIMKTMDNRIKVDPDILKEYL